MTRSTWRIWGALSPLGWAIAVFGFAADQAVKWWLLGPFDIAARQPVEVTGFLDLVLVWNRGISYGLLAQDSDLGRWILVALATAIVVVLAFWLAATTRPLAAAAFGLVLGGAAGNIVDRVLYGAVADFVSLHAYGFHWYVFNLADVMIVAGIGLLLYDWWRDGRVVGAE